MAAAGALVVVLALAIAIVALGRDGDAGAASVTDAAQSPIAPAKVAPRLPDPGKSEAGASRPPRTAARAVPAKAGGPSREAPRASNPNRATASMTARRDPANGTSIGTSGRQTHGWVALRAPIPMELWQDGRVIGRAGGRVRLPPGQHVVDLVNERLNYRERRTVAVTAGTTSQLRPEVPSGSISLNAVPWAAVWIDDRRVGETPLGELPVALGEHVIRFEHPQLGERRETVLVKAGEVTRVTVNLRQ